MTTLFAQLCETAEKSHSPLEYEHDQQTTSGLVNSILRVLSSRGMLAAAVLGCVPHRGLWDTYYAEGLGTYVAGFREDWKWNHEAVCKLTPEAQLALFEALNPQSEV